tara:strand:- start:196 stop:552 length:357 start_codon:yes stop_codon:yes gene_type:complete
MSRYDTVKLEYSIPEHLKLPLDLYIGDNLSCLEYQTTDFDGGNFEEYRIDSDGLMWKRYDKFDDAYSEIIWYLCANYSGEFNITTKISGKWLEFKCVVIGGKLEKFKLLGVHLAKMVF